MGHVPHVRSAGINACGQNGMPEECNQVVLIEAGTKPELNRFWY